MGYILLGFDQSLKIEQQFAFPLPNSSSPRVLYESEHLRNILGISHVLHRKEVIQPHLPIRLPCYDLTPVIKPTIGAVLLAVRPATSGVFDSHGLTGGVYKARERIHRGMLIRDY